MFDDIKSVAKHFMIYGMGSILGRIAGFILLPLYTHYLSTSEYGTLELLELTTYIVGMFMAAGISHSLLRFYYDTDVPEEKDIVASTALISIWVFSTLGFIILALTSNTISNLVFSSNDYTELFRLVFLGMMFSLIGEIPLSLFRAQQKSTLYTVISLIKLIINLCLNIVLIVKYDMGIRGIIISSLTTHALTCIVFSIYTIKKTGLHFSYPKFKEMLIYGLPLIPEGVGQFVLIFVDRFILQRFTTLSNVGIYSLGYKFGMIISPMITDPFLSIWRPKMFELANKENAKNFFETMFTYFIFIQIYFGLSISVLIIDALKIISNPEYYSAYKIVPFISFSYILSGAYYFMQMGLLLKKKTKHFTYIVLVIAAINTGLNFLLIPIIGIWGAVFSTTISYLLLVIFIYVISSKIYYLKYQYLRIFKLFAAAAIIYLLAYYIKIDSLVVSVSIKILLLVSYPFILYIMGFYISEEINKLKVIYSKIILTIKNRKK